MAFFYIISWENAILAFFPIPLRKNHQNGIFSYYFVKKCRFSIFSILYNKKNAAKTFFNIQLIKKNISQRFFLFL
jgi:hypothetical protein